MSIYKHQLGFKIQNQKADNNLKNEYQAADRPPMDRGPSAASGNGQSVQPRRPSAHIRARTVRRPSADRPRQGSKVDQWPQTCHLCSLALPLLLSKYSLVLSVHGRCSEVACGQSDSLRQHFINMSSSRYLQSCEFHQVSSILRLFGFPL
jgi:hypothetical protein